MRLERTFCKLVRQTLALPLVALVAACGGPEVGGQVLASIDDEAITQAELSHEFDLGNRVDAEEGRARANAALEQVVDRKLLAQVALERELDLTADFHFAERRAREDLLVDALRRQLADKYAQVSETQIAQFVASNPHLFAGRRLLTLRARNDSRTLVLDTARLGQPPEWLETVAPGRDLMLDGEKWAVLAVDRIDSPRQTQHGFAKQLIIEENVEAELARTLRELRQREPIRYQQGWGPSAQ